MKKMYLKTEKSAQSGKKCKNTRLNTHLKIKA